MYAAFFVFRATLPETHRQKGEHKRGLRIAVCNDTNPNGGGSKKKLTRWQKQDLLLLLGANREKKKKGEKRMKEEEDFKSEIKGKKEVRRLPSWILHPSWKQSSWYIRIDWGGNTKKLLIMYYTAALLPFVYNNNTESPAEKGRLCVPEFQLKWTACCCCTLNVNQVRWRSRWIPRKKPTARKIKNSFKP